MKWCVALAAICGFGNSLLAADFDAPVLVTGGDRPIQVESPGYAAPCLADIDGDGIEDLLVGQFNGGKIRQYRGLGPGRFDKGTWLKAGGAVAQVPGVW